MTNKKIIIALGFVLILGTFGNKIHTLNKKSEIDSVYLRDNDFLVKEIKEVVLKFPKKKAEKAVAVVSSHHLLAKDLIGETFSKIENNQIERVIIISPNHFRQIKETKCLGNQNHLS